MTRGFFSQQFEATRSCLGISLMALAVLGGSACSNSGKGGPGLTAKWPKSSSMSHSPLPPATTWTGVFFLNSGGSRGTMHVLPSGESKVYGCWLAEDKHARATFVGNVIDNILQVNWTEKRVGAVGTPARIAGYFVLTPDPEGRDKIVGEYGEDLSTDSGSKWEGIRQKHADAKIDGCKLDDGDTLPTEVKPLE